VFDTGNPGFPTADEFGDACCSGLKRESLMLWRWLAQHLQFSISCMDLTKVKWNPETW